MRRKYTHTLYIALMVTMGVITSAFAHNSFQSFTTIEYNPRTNHVEVIMMIHRDELEAILSARYGMRLSFLHENERDILDQEAQKELLKSYDIMADGKPLTLTYLGWELDGSTVTAYLRAPYDTTPQTYSVMMRLLLEELDGQKNHILIVGEAGKRAAVIKRDDDPVFFDMSDPL